MGVTLKRYLLLYESEYGMIRTSNSRWWAMAATAMSLLVVGLDMTVLNVALPDIAVDLSASSAQLQWFADSYLLVLSAALLPAGMLGDRFGRKRLTLGALVVFGAGSAWCAFAASPAALIAARTLLGLGAAVLIPLAMSAVVVLFAPHERQKAVLILGGSTMLGLPLGPIVAGVLLQHFWWGSVFLINVPVVVVALFAVTVFLPESAADDDRRRFDWLGVVASATGLFGLTFGVIEGPERGWSEPLVLVSIIGGLLVLGGFLLWEGRAQHVQPVLDVALWRNPSFRWGSVAAAIASLAFFGLMFVVPQYLRAVLGADALGTGLRTLPMVGGLLVGMRGAMVLSVRWGATVIGASGFLLIAAGLFLGATTDVGDGYGLTATWTAAVGAGFGMALFCAQNAALESLPKQRAAAGSALVQTLRQVGSVIGIAVLGALLNGVYRSDLSVGGFSGPVAEAARENVVSGIAVGTQLHSAELVASVRAAFVEGMTTTLWVSGGVALLGAVLVGLFLPSGRSRGEAPVEEMRDAAQSEHAVDAEEQQPVG